MEGKANGLLSKLKLKTYPVPPDSESDLLEGMENKFIVLKREDVDKFLDYEDKAYLGYAHDKVETGRALEGKKSNTYIVINTDEPYIEEVIEILKKNGHWGSNE